MPADGLPRPDGRLDKFAAIALIVKPAQVVALWAVPALVARQMIQQAGFRVGLEDSDEMVRFKLLAATWAGESQRSVQHFRQLAATVQQAMAVALGLDAKLTGQETQTRKMGTSTCCSHSAVSQNGPRIQHSATD
jgi:hypothetical protein